MLSIFGIYLSKMILARKIFFNLLIVAFFLNVGVASLSLIREFYKEISVVRHGDFWGLAIPLPGDLPSIPLYTYKYLIPLFRTYGVFRGYTTYNSDVILWGYFPKSDTWYPIGHEDRYLPYVVSSRTMKMRMSTLRYYSGEARGDQKIDKFSRQVQNIYNREHPQNPISELTIYIKYWPTSHKSYRENFSSDKAFYNKIYSTNEELLKAKREELALREVEVK